MRPLQRSVKQGLDGVSEIPETSASIFSTIEDRLTPSRLATSLARWDTAGSMVRVILVFICININHTHTYCNAKQGTYLEEEAEHQKLQEDLANLHREALEEAKTRPPPDTVSAFRDVYGHWPKGFKDMKNPTSRIPLYPRLSGSTATRDTGVSTAWAKTSKTTAAWKSRAAVATDRTIGFCIYEQSQQESQPQPQSPQESGEQHPMQSKQ